MVVDFKQLQTQCLDILKQHEVKQSWEVYNPAKAVYAGFSFALGGQSSAYTAVNKADARDKAISEINKAQKAEDLALAVLKLRVVVTEYNEKHRCGEGTLLPLANAALQAIAEQDERTIDFFTTEQRHDKLSQLMQEESLTHGLAEELLTKIGNAAVEFKAEQEKQKKSQGSKKK